MSVVHLRIPAPLRGLTGGNDVVAGEGSTVRDVLLSLDSPPLLEAILDTRGNVRSFVNLFVGEVNIRSLDGLDTKLEGGEIVSILPAVAGGTGAARNRRLAELRDHVPEVTPEEALAGT